MTTSGPRTDKCRPPDPDGRVRHRRRPRGDDHPRGARRTNVARRAPATVRRRRTTQARAHRRSGRASRARNGVARATWGRVYRISFQVEDGLGGEVLGHRPRRRCHTTSAAIQRSTQEMCTWTSRWSRPLSEAHIEPRSRSRWRTPQVEGPVPDSLERPRASASRTGRLFRCAWRRPSRRHADKGQSATRTNGLRPRVRVSARRGTRRELATPSAILRAAS